jgi:RND family efflux transporter MFP subunit
MSKSTPKQTIFKRLGKAKWLLLAAVIAGLGIFYFASKNNQEDLRTAIVKRQDIVESVNASGELQAKQSAELRFNTPSKVVWLGIEKGDQVKKWQSVASLDKRTLEKNLRKKLLDYQTTRWDFEQTQDNYDIDGRQLAEVILTDEEKRILEKTQFGLDKSVIDVEIADLAAKDAVLISPIAGTVISTGGLVVGENLTATNLATKFIKVADLSTLQFIALVDEVDYGKIHPGQKVNIMLDAFPDETFVGTVSFINKEGVKNLSGGVTIPIEITLDTKDDRLVVGLSGEADFVIQEKDNTLTVPREFIQTKEGKTYVYVMENNQPTMKEVVTGLSTISQTEIISGLEENQELVLIKNNGNTK